MSNKEIYQTFDHCQCVDVVKWPMMLIHQPIRVLPSRRPISELPDAKILFLR